MEKLENFIAKARLFKIFLAMFLLTSTLVASVFWLIFVTGLTRPDLSFTGIACIQIGIFFGLIFGVLSVFLVGQMRESQRFWNYAKEVEEIIDNAKSRDDLESIVECEFDTLVDLSLGGPHNHELLRLKTIIRTKYKYLN